MIILGIESSCDEAAAAVVKNHHQVLSNVVHSQIDLHANYGGVIPELAARSHLEVINPVINQALTDAKLTWQDIDAIAVTNRPGLIGSLLIGTLAARTIALIQNKPLIGVHHVLAHFFANYLTDPNLLFPNLCLTVSGGHTRLILFDSPTSWQSIGTTQDDAAGEAFDKVAKIIGLGYPGGPAISQAAQNGDSKRYQLPIAKLANPYDFSFSGLKTAVLRLAQAEVGGDYTLPTAEIAPKLTSKQQADIAAAFQATAVETLVQKTKTAARELKPKAVSLAGGVAANQLLRQRFQEEFSALTIPNFDYCTDNAAMIACLGSFLFAENQITDPRQLEVQPSAPLT